jgi:hypothetical protein
LWEIDVLMLAIYLFIVLAFAFGPQPPVTSLAALSFNPFFS